MDNMDSVFNKSIEDNELFSLILDDAEDAVFERIFAEDVEAAANDDTYLDDAEEVVSSDLGDKAPAKVECNECGDENKAEGTDTKFTSIDDKIDIDDVAPAQDDKYNDSHTPDVKLEKEAAEIAGDEDKAEGTDEKFSSIDTKVDIDDVAPAQDDEYNDSHTPDVKLAKESVFRNDFTAFTLVESDIPGDEDKAEGTDEKFSSIDTKVDIDDVAPAQDDEYNDSHTPDVKLAKEDADVPGFLDSEDPITVEGEEGAEEFGGDEDLGVDKVDEETELDSLINDEDEAIIDDIESGKKFSGEIDLEYDPDEDDQIIASLEMFI